MGGLLIFLLLVIQEEAGYMSVCGTNLSKEQVNYELQHVLTQNPKLQKLDFATTLAINVIVIENEDGSTPINEEEIFKALDRLNASFSAINLNFEICNINYLREPQLYSYDITEEPFLEKYIKPNNINLFFVKDIQLSEPGNTCGYTYYPVHRKDFIVLKGECCINNSSLNHEMGHFFGLYHTHEKIFGQEYADESNCYQSGDLLCDTPADPGIHTNITDENCQWIGHVNDIKGKAYHPDMQNYMSYGRNECRSHFTKDQYNKMVNMYCIFKSHLQQLDVRFKMSDSLVFPNEAVTLSATGGYKYEWSNGDSTRSTVIFPQNDTIVTLKLSRPGQCSIIKKFPIHVIPDSYLTGKNEVCIGETVEINVNSSRIGVNYQLRQNDEKIGAVIQGNGSVITFKSKPLYKNTIFSVIACDTKEECDFVLSDKHKVKVAGLPPKTGLVQLLKDGDSWNLVIENSSKKCYYNLLINDEKIGNRVKGNGKRLVFKITNEHEGKMAGLEISTACERKKIKDTFMIGEPQNQIFIDKIDSNFNTINP